jgi:hypothetical protein
MYSDELGGNSPAVFATATLGTRATALESDDDDRYRRPFTDESDEDGGDGAFPRVFVYYYLKICGVDVARMPLYSGRTEPTTVLFPLFQMLHFY